ncbi:MULTISPECIES: ABC transporter permease [unclassified Mesorhizobium]|uniref:ABC transporter permease n=1 Tax=unclassified Mesorhizobium TaxID=325217 RepID=UPI000FD36E26|nr:MULTISPECIES: ABC transporter permease [unclassified Mesorhizobium]RUV30343.1 ABC transporter permease [Mesorhizobium sp. M5C.F.Ca.IN.020.32.2.1]RWH46532.1 MAG: ABC transporter permease [Mesorhizobium sp.]RWH51055.1 MAG: ABC transporter permease [Mesorhizobium sp.]RWI65318.1 MAG: ABC transporter permease [Mesorhizobium sp.]RWI79089.1 MAG: ABC transporter permease [Mesorhizobium sp.]
MAQTTHGVGGLSYDAKKRTWPAEFNVFLALIILVGAFELIGRVFLGDSFLFNTRANVDTIFNEARLQIIILQVSIVGIIAIGVTQVIISGGIDLSSGSVVGATAMIAMSFAQVATVNGNPNPKAMFIEQGWTDLPVIVPVLVAIGCGLLAGLINGTLVAYTRIPPFIATLGMMVTARGVAKWWSKGQPISFPTEGFAAIGKGLMPVIIFISLAILFQLILSYTRYGKHCYAIGSNEDAARMSGINVQNHKILVFVIAGILASLAAVVLSSKNLTAQAGMGVMYELDAIAMAVIGGVSLSGGRGSIIGTVIGALIFGVIISGFTFLRLDAYYQEMVKGVIIIGAVVLDQWRQRLRAMRA